MAQAAFSMLLLASAGLFVTSLRNVESINTGYDRHDLLLIQPSANADSLRATLPAVVRAVRGLPGVEAVAQATSLPFLERAQYALFVPGADSAVTVGGSSLTAVEVSPEFFGAAGLRIVAGRAFTDGDRRGTPPVIVINRNLARTIWHEQSPIGKCLMVWTAGAPCRTVVGVAEDVHESRLVQQPALQFYLPLAQGTGRVGSALIVRATPRRLAAVAEQARAIVRRLMPAARYTRIETMDDVLAPELRPWRLGATLLSGVGALALLIVAAGVYSVVAYSASQRTRELSIRIALGARLSDVVRLVVREGFAAIGVGIALGASSMLALGRLAASLLYGVAPTDARVLIASAATLVVLGAAACIVPAWRAACVDPATVLRAD